MRTLTLQLDTIHVQSFATLAAPRPEGTVRAHEHGESDRCASNQATCDTCQGDNCTHGCPA